MTDETNGAAAEATAPDLTLNVPVAHSALEGGEDRNVLIDLSAIPADARLELLKAQVRTIIQNRVNVANVRRNKERAPFLAWAAYNAAVTADPLQTAVAKPEGEAPTGTDPGPLDTLAKAGEAVADLLKGEIRAQVKRGEGQSRKPRDPLVAAVTQVVTRAVFEANKAAAVKVDNGKGGTRPYGFPDATKEVGGDGIAYLNKQIDAKVAAGADRAALEKSRDQRYIEPAKVMLGMTAIGKKGAELPSIL